MLYQQQSVGYTINRKVQGAVSSHRGKGTQLTEKFKVLYQPQREGYTINRKVQGAVSATECRANNLNRKVQGAVSTTEGRVHN